MARNKEFNTDDALDKALGLFLKSGYNGASMQDVVDYTGLSRSSIYDTFTDKHGLFMEALKKYHRESTGRIVKLIDETKDLRQTLEDIFTNVIDDATSPTPGACLMTNSAVELAAGDEQIQAAVKANMEDIIAALTNAISRERARSGRKGGAAGQVLASYIFTYLGGIRVAARSGASAIDLKEGMRVVLQSLDI